MSIEPVSDIVARLESELARAKTAELWQSQRLAECEAANRKLRTDLGEAMYTLKLQQPAEDAILACATRAEVKVEQLTAEVEVLRGVGCEADGDGPCGVCIKCYARDARRYRAIRSICSEQMVRTLTDWAGDTLAPGEELDEAVDTAIAQHGLPL